VRLKLHDAPVARAFTLIEMILALGISALVLVGVSTILFSALNLRASTQALVDAATPLDQTSDLLRRDLQCAMPPYTNGTFSGDFKVGNVSSTGIGQPVAIEMYTATGALSESKPWGDVQRVTYKLRLPTDPRQPGKDLVRSVSRNILATSTMDVEDQWMMGGVSQLTISCYDGMQWQTAWDTTDLTGSTTNLPLAVKVEIQLAGANNGGLRPPPIQFLVPLDTQSRTNT
jgi:type II secretion system protein J